ncbi:MAG: hypothetical protein LRY51_01230 [Geovibrio sp.]|nr:hypothetical protein [Geovibrio sp.]
MDFKDLKKELKLTSQEISDLTGTPKRSIDNWSAGRNAPPEVMIAWLKMERMRRAALEALEAGEPDKAAEILRAP